MELTLPEPKRFNSVVLVCASCKKIRDDNGVWVSPDESVDTTRDVVFSHGLCPDCMRALYPEVADKVLERKGGKSPAGISG
jgi:hypothetical protein